VSDSFSHFDDRGASRMVDVSEKATSRREAVAVGKIRMSAATLQKVLDRDFSKGDVLEVARLAGIMAAKKTADLIPLCHPLPISAVTVDLAAVSATEFEVRACVATEAKTGVEMEALTAAAVACLTVYDMCKGTERGISIGPLELVSKSGARSGAWVRPETASPEGDDAREARKGG
jgi:cyclic pyranopterin phosphate synthase